MLIAIGALVIMIIILLLYILLFHNKKKVAKPSSISLGNKKGVLGVSEETVLPVKFKGLYISTNIKDKDIISLLNKFEVVLTEALMRNNPVLIRQFLSMKSYSKLTTMMKNSAIIVVPLTVRDTHYELVEVNKESKYSKFKRNVKCHRVKVEGKVMLPLGEDDELHLDLDLEALMAKSIYILDVLV